MTLRTMIGLIAGMALIGVMACSDDEDNGNTGATTGTGTAAGQPPASRPDYCDELDTVRGDAVELEAAARSLDRGAAEAAVRDLRTDVERLRNAVRGGEDNEEIDQAAADLAGAVDGLETTMRQASQGDTTATGVIQELQIQIPAITASLSDLREEAQCN